MQFVGRLLGELPKSVCKKCYIGRIDEPLRLNFLDLLCSAA